MGFVATVCCAAGIWGGVVLARKLQSRPTTTLHEVLPAETVTSTTAQDNPLTQREREVLALMAEGCSNQEMAERLFLSLNTVKTHVSNIFAKLDVERRTQAIQKATSKGWLT